MSEQLDWLAKAHARTRDKRTSHAAAQSVAPTASGMALMILSELKANGPGTQTELAARCKLRPDQVWRRLSDLKNQELIADTGHTRPGETARQQTVWSAV